MRMAMHTCPYCARRVRGPSYFRHEQACAKMATRKPARAVQRRRDPLSPFAAFARVVRAEVRTAVAAALEKGVA